MQHQINTLATYVWKKDEILGTDACNVRVQPSQHMQYSNLLLQHSYETLETYFWNNWNTWNIGFQHVWKHLKHLKHSVVGCHGLPMWGTAVTQASHSCQRREVNGGAGAGVCTGLPCLPFRDKRGGWGRGAGWWHGVGARSSAGVAPPRWRRPRLATPTMEKANGAFLEAVQRRWPWAAAQNLRSCYERRRRKLLRSCSRRRGNESWEDDIGWIECIRMYEVVSVGQEYTKIKVCVRLIL
jgi:hypothetical protein